MHVSVHHWYVFGFLVSCSALLLLLITRPEHICAETCLTCCCAMLHAEWRGRWFSSLSISAGLACALLVAVHLLLASQHSTTEQQDTSRELHSLPIGVRTWEETFGACIAMCQVAYSTLDAWSATVRITLPAGPRGCSRGTFCTFCKLLYRGKVMAFYSII